ncbi:hypothetical protein CBR_g32379 [Chara braunii]|uniref:Uncharacterized protein n=1 Tax=Chara braunii TaxID=69332 RepID=A0A388JYA7_CHABU|nr:hypothetical protein CBR_g32379 [Chara braunii]|eukprot:GBG62790.1 hypothetical protein CBR_g32379 [Chara braunii]
MSTFTTTGQKRKLGGECHARMDDFLPPGGKDHNTPETDRNRGRTVVSDREHIGRLTEEVHKQKVLLSEMSDELRRVKSLLDEMTETAEHRMFTVFWLLLDNPKDILDVTRLREDMSARLQAIVEMNNTTFDEFQAWLDIEKERRTAVLKWFSAHVTKTTNRESDGGDVMCLASCEKCVLMEGWASYNSQDYNTGSLPTTTRSVVDLLAFAEDCIRHCSKTVDEHGLSEVRVGSVNDEFSQKIATLLSSCSDVMDVLQHTRGRMLAGELTVTCTEGDVMGCGEGETKKGREEPDKPIGVCSGNGATLGKDAPAPHVVFACSDVAALKSHHVRHNFPCVLARKAPSAVPESSVMPLTTEIFENFVADANSQQMARLVVDCFSHIISYIKDIMGPVLLNAGRHGAEKNCEYCRKGLDIHERLETLYRRCQIVAARVVRVA